MQAPKHCTTHCTLPAGLRLRRGQKEEDVRAVLEAHLASFDDEDRLVLEWKLLHRPHRCPADLLLVEEASSGRVASSVSLVKQTWAYEGIPLAVGEVGIVSTRPEYRKRGLVRALFQAYHRLALCEGCLLSVISGIPYFYRQFGYAYALPMGGGWRLNTDQIPARNEEGPVRYTVRRAAEGDTSTLLAFYRASVEGLNITSVLEGDIWAYQEHLPQEASERKETYLLEEDGRPCGYWRINGNEEGWDKGVVFHAAYLPRREMCLEALHFAKALALTRQEHTVTLQVPLEIPLAQAMQDLGAQAVPSYAWYVRVLDPVRFMHAIAPALEARLALSPFAGLDETFHIGLYREVLLLRFRQGRLLCASLSADVGRTDVRLPPEVTPMWWLDYRSIGEILAWHPDARCRDRSKERLADTLFPKRPSWVTSLL